MKFVHERARDAAPRLECNRRPPRSSEQFSGFAPRDSRLRRRKHRSYTRKYMHARNEHSTPRSTRAPRRSTQDASTCRSRRMQCMGPGSYNRRRPPTCSCAGPRARVMAREMGHAACERAAHTSKAAPHGARPALSHDSRPNLSCGEAPRSVAAAAPTSASKTMRDAADDMSCVKLCTRRQRGQVTCFAKKDSGCSGRPSDHRDALAMALERVAEGLCDSRDVTLWSVGRSASAAPLPR